LGTFFKNDLENVCEIYTDLKANKSILYDYIMNDSIRQPKHYFLHEVQVIVISYNQYSNMKVSVHYLYPFIFIIYKTLTRSIFHIHI